MPQVSSLRMTSRYKSQKYRSKQGQTEHSHKRGPYANHNVNENVARQRLMSKTTAQHSLKLSFDILFLANLCKTKKFVTKHSVFIGTI